MGYQNVGGSLDKPRFQRANAAAVPPVRRSRSAGVRRNTALGVPAAAQIVSKAARIVDERQQRFGVAERRHAADRKAGFSRTKSASARMIFSPMSSPTLRSSTRLNSGGDHQHRAPGRLGAKDQRFGDLSYSAADRRRRVRRRAGAGVELLSTW